MTASRRRRRWCGSCAKNHTDVAVRTKDLKPISQVKATGPGSAGCGAGPDPEAKRRANAKSNAKISAKRRAARELGSQRAAPLPQSAPPDMDRHDSFQPPSPGERRCDGSCGCELTEAQVALEIEETGTFSHWPDCHFAEHSLCIQRPACCHVVQSGVQQNDSISPTARTRSTARRARRPAGSDRRFM